MIERFQSFVTGISACYKAIQRIKSAEMTEFGLHGTHVMCLFFLHQHGEGLTAAQLCQLCGEDKAAVSRTLQTLREQGYIDGEGGRYRARLQLTSRGEKMALRIEELIDHWVSSGGDGLTEEERTIFYRALDRIAANLREESLHISHEKNPERNYDGRTFCN